MKIFTFKDLKFEPTDMPKVKEAKLFLKNKEIFIYEDLMTNQYVFMLKYGINFVTKEYPINKTSEKLISNLVRELL